MNVFMRFPNGKLKALTLSYDDGVESDIRLIEIMKKHGILGTFNINSGLFAPEGTVYQKGTVHRRMSLSQTISAFSGSGMEVAVHGLTHPFLEKLPLAICTREILKDRENLEEIFGIIVRGMAYPYGTFNDGVVEVLRCCGIAYSRTVISTERFDIPSDWLLLPATCHHNNPRLMELAEKFVEKSTKAPQLFYLWGHSYEFEIDNNWNVIEQFTDYICGREDIWYVTNISLFDYISAYNTLVFSTDGRRVYNPSAQRLWFEISGEIYEISPGEIINTKIN